MNEVLNYLPALIAVSVFITVTFCEIIKAIDKQERLKPIRPYIPAFVSLFLVGLLAFGGVIVSKMIPFYWLVVTGSAVFFYDAILQKIKNYKRQNDNSKSY